MEVEKVYKNFYIDQKERFKCELNVLWVMKSGFYVEK